MSRNKKYGLAARNGVRSEASKAEAWLRHEVGEKSIRIYVPFCSITIVKL